MVLVYTWPPAGRELWTIQDYGLDYFFFLQTLSVATAACLRLQTTRKDLWQDANSDFLHQSGSSTPPLSTSLNEGHRTHTTSCLGTGGHEVQTGPIFHTFLIDYFVWVKLLCHCKNLTVIKICLIIRHCADPANYGLHLVFEVVHC